MSGTVTQQYAHLANGIVREYPVVVASGFTLAQCYNAAYVADCAPVPAGVNPANGWSAVEVSGVWTFTAPAAIPGPPLTKQAASASIAGLTIASTGPTLTMAATLFPSDTTTQAKLNTVVNALNTAGTFPGGADTFPMIDSAGIWHTFTIAQYKAVALALFSYVATLDLIAAGNPLNATVLPASSTTISV